MTVKQRKRPLGLLRGGGPRITPSESNKRALSAAAIAQHQLGVLIDDAVARINLENVTDAAHLNEAGRQARRREAAKAAVAKLSDVEKLVAHAEADACEARNILEREYETALSKVGAVELERAKLTAAMLCRPDVTDEQRKQFVDGVQKGDRGWLVCAQLMPGIHPLGAKWGGFAREKFGQQAIQQVPRTKPDAFSLDTEAAKRTGMALDRAERVGAAEAAARLVRQQLEDARAALTEHAQQGHAVGTNAVVDHSPADLVAFEMPLAERIELGRLGVIEPPVIRPPADEQTFGSEEHWRERLVAEQAANPTGPQLDLPEPKPALQLAEAQ
jgi:hypothetical protein